MGGPGGKSLHRRSLKATQVLVSAPISGLVQTANPGPACQAA